MFPDARGSWRWVGRAARQEGEDSGKRKLAGLLDPEPPTTAAPAAACRECHGEGYRRMSTGGRLLDCSPGCVR